MAFFHKNLPFGFTIPMDLNEFKAIASKLGGDPAVLSGTVKNKDIGGSYLYDIARAQLSIHVTDFFSVEAKVASQDLIQEHIESEVKSL